jgi:uncharacterized OsmC-like protein
MQFTASVRSIDGSPRRRDWDLGGARVDVAYESDTSPRRVRIDIHLPASLTPEQVQRLRHVADTCPVRRALQAGFAFDQQLVLDLERQPAL